jgi:hypothetical protein
LDLEPDPWVFLQNVAYRVEDWEALGANDGFVVFEVNLFGDLDFAVRNDGQGRLLRTALRIPVSGAGLVRALVVTVQDLVLVVVRIWASVIVFEPVGILRFEGALVFAVDDGVRVVVEIRATVLIEVLIEVLGFEDAAIFGVGDLVAVRIGILGAPVTVFDAVVVLGIIGALVDGVDETITVAILSKDAGVRRRKK